MDRRLFLKLSGFVAAASALQVLPVAAQGHADRVDAQARPTPAAAELHAPGVYQISGRVRLEAPVVAISGITNAQQISWSDARPGGAHVAGFSSYEYFAEPWQMPQIHVRGGALESVAVVPLEMA